MYYSPQTLQESVTCNKGNQNSEDDKDANIVISHVCSPTGDDSITSSSVTFVSEPCGTLTQGGGELAIVTESGEAVKKNSEPTLHIVWPHRWKVIMCAVAYQVGLGHLFETGHFSLPGQPLS